MYALRRIRDGFKDSRCLIDRDDIIKHYNEGLRSLQVIKRQVSYLHQSMCSSSIVKIW